MASELEVNYEHWSNGEHVGLTQVLLTPGLILGRFPIGYDTPTTRPINLIIGAGYQIAVTANPVTQNNFVGTLRDHLLIFHRVTSQISSAEC